MACSHTLARYWASWKLRCNTMYLFIFSGSFTYRRTLCSNAFGPYLSLQSRSVVYSSRRAFINNSLDFTVAAVPRFATLWKHSDIFSASKSFSKVPLIMGHFKRGLSQMHASCFFDSAKFVIPHPSKKNKEGDDAAFCTSWHLGVADGVGGWTLSGVDAGLYSRELIHRIEKILQQDEIPQEIPSPVRILKEAYKSTRAIGSCTCCLVFLDASKMQILSANLGDSGFIVYRPSKGEIVCQSEFQYHNFNFPLQLGTGSLDLPEHSEQQEFDVSINDWVVIGTDGLWDNLYEHQIIKILSSASNSRMAAQTLARVAYRFSQDPHWKSPFIEREIRFGGKSSYRGGKPDDISVVVAQIRQSAGIFGNALTEKEDSANPG